MNVLLLCYVVLSIYITPICINYNDIDLDMDKMSIFGRIILVFHTCKTENRLEI